MSKRDFIDRLRMALTGRVAPEVVQENVNYYEDYINTQIRMGRSVEDVLDSLGDPRLIAKTIVATNNQRGTDYSDDEDYQSETYHDAGYQGENYSNTNYLNRGKVFSIPGWAWTIIVILVIVLIFGMVFSVLSFLAPILVPMLVVIFLVKLFRDWLN